VSRLPEAFFARDARTVARELLGKRLVRDEVVLSITEVEAYFWPGDSACHARHGRTARNDAMWGPAGRAYVYLCYGLHHLLNLSADRDGQAAAVLIRACAPVSGLEIIRRRRGGKRGPVLLTGPGKVGQALSLDTSWSGHPLHASGGLEVHDGPAPARVAVGPRVGVGYALPQDQEAHWRYADADTPWVSQRQTLVSQGA